MSLTVCWDNAAKTIIRYNFGVTWTWQEFHNAVLQANELMNAVPHRVDILMNVEITRGLPPGNPANMFKWAFDTLAPNGGIVVVAGATPLIRMMLEAFSAIYKREGEQLRITDSLHQAHEILVRLQAEGGQSPGLARAGR